MLRSFMDIKHPCIVIIISIIVISLNYSPMRKFASLTDLI